MPGTKLFIGGGIGRNSLSLKDKGLFGGLTTAFSVIREMQDGRRLATQFDLGTGCVLCANWFKSQGIDLSEVSTASTHGHWDHWAGDQNWDAFFTPGDHIIYLPRLTNRHEKVLRAYLEILTDPVMWPISAEMFKGKIVPEFFNPGDELPLLGGLKTKRLPHPQGVIAYSTEEMVLATDNELATDEDQQSFADFAEGSRLILIDVQYRHEEYTGERAINGCKAGPKKGFGHNSDEMLLSVLRKMNSLPEFVIVTHHDPDRGAEDLMRFSIEMEMKAPKGCKIRFAKEGDVFEI